MPQRTRIMQDESIHLPVTTGSAALIYGWTLQEFVLILWALYVCVLIIIKLPELGSSMARIKACVGRRWATWRRRDGD